jgi:hypothetical protein
MNISIKSPTLKSSFRFPSTNRKEQHNSISSMMRKRVMEETETTKKKLFKERRPSNNEYSEQIEICKLREALELKDRIITMHYQIILQFHEKLRLKEQNMKYLMDIIKGLKTELINNNIELPVIQNTEQGEVTVVQDNLSVEQFANKVHKILSFPASPLEIPQNNKYITQYDYFIKDIASQGIMPVVRRGMEFQRKQIRSRGSNSQKQKSNRSLSNSRHIKNKSRFSSIINQSQISSVSDEAYSILDSQYRNITNYALIESLVDSLFSEIDTQALGEMNPSSQYAAIKRVMMNSLSSYFICKTLNLCSSSIDSSLARLVDMLFKIMRATKVVIYLDYGTEYLVAKCVSGKCNNPFQVHKGKGRKRE